MRIDHIVKGVWARVAAMFNLVELRLALELRPALVYENLSGGAALDTGTFLFN
jgi:hypothetical protein